MREESVIIELVAAVKRVANETDAALFDRVERSAEQCLNCAPFSGFDGVRFYTGAVRFDAAAPADREE